MNCQKCKIEIEERDLRRESLSDAAQAHLGTCANCRVFGEERLALRRLVGGLEKITAPADFDFRMRARMAAELSASAPRSGWFSLTPAALSWPLAGCLALLISASLYLQQRGADATISPAAEVVSFASPTPTVVEVASNGESSKPDEIRPRVDAPTAKHSTTQRRRVVSAERPVGNARVETATAQERIIVDSNSAGVMGAPMRFATNGVAKGESAMIPVPLSAPERPLQVLLRDTSGSERTISVESVSFGSRDALGRAAKFTKASVSTNQGVW